MAEEWSGRKETPCSGPGVFFSVTGSTVFSADHGHNRNLTTSCSTNVLLAQMTTREEVVDGWKDKALTGAVHRGKDQCSLSLIKSTRNTSREDQVSQS